MFVGRVPDADLGEDAGHLRGVGGDQVVAGHVAVAAAAEHLAVDRHVADGGRVDPSLEPAGQDGLQAGGVEAAEGAGQGGHGRGLAAAEPEGVGQRGAVLAAEPGDAGEALSAHQQGEGDEPEDGREGVELAVATAGVGQGGEGVVQGGSHGTLRGTDGRGCPLYPTSPPRPRSIEEWPWMYTFRGQPMPLFSQMDFGPGDDVARFCCFSIFGSVAVVVILYGLWVMFRK